MPRRTTRRPLSCTTMIRRDHFFYDLREALGNPKLLVGLGVFAAFFVLFVSWQLVYLFAVLFGVVIGVYALIGRRCPHCDAQLKEKDAERDKEDAMVLYIIWTCPNDGYEEKEKVRGDSGLFGAK